jgi:peptidase E
MPQWNNVLLTDAGFFDPRSNLEQPVPFPAIIDRFAKMLGKPFNEAKVLFIPTAAQNEEAKKYADILKEELFWIGIIPENLTVHDIDGTLTEDDSLNFDVIFFTGGEARYLLKRIKETRFDKIIKNMVYANKVYIGVSAGPIIATPNIGACFGSPYDEETASLNLINAYIDVHCDSRQEIVKPQDLSLPHIMLSSYQALAVSSYGYELIEEGNLKFK